MDRSHPAWVRMKFDELLAQQLSLKRAQRARRAKGAPVIKTVGTLSEAFTGVLPFKLTGAQARVLKEIRADLRHPYPMQRLLQGDVGSGKTVVAALAAAQAIDSGYQAALMAPTEILADQHFRKIAALDGAARRQGRVADRQPEEKGQAGRHRAGRIGRSAAGDRHPRADPGHGAVRETGPGDRRRAAPLRRRPAPHLAQQGQQRQDAAPADDVGHADPAHAGDDLLRRPRSVGHRRAAAGPQPDRHARDRPEPARRSDRARARGGARRPPGVLGLPADRRIRSAAAADRDRHPRDAGRGAARPAGGPGARAPEAGREAGSDGCVHRQRRCRCWWRPP